MSKSGVPGVRTPRRARLPPLAKLHPPRLFAPVLRNRLFDRLDTRARSPVVWVAGPPGSGKTTLVASFLSLKRRRTYWFQVDEGDRDAATFFYYLTELAGQAAPEAATDLPFLTPEYLADVPGFARRFFRAFYRHLPRGSVLVFDNCHEADSETMHAILREAVAELPPDLGLTFVSRTQPPDELSGARARGQLGLLGWEDLRLTPDEAESVVRAQPGVPPDCARRLVDHADGWVTGLILLAANARDRHMAEAPMPVTHEDLFKYFAGEILLRVPAAVRDTLVRTSLLSDMTVPMAEAISGNPEVGRVLESLYRRHYFTDRRVDSEVHYRYHDLFRTFLLERFESTYDLSDQDSLRRSAAQLLQTHGHIGDAVDLFAKARSWENLTHIIQAHGNALLEEGRWQTLAAWIGRLPTTVVTASAWLTFYRASALSVPDPDAALTEYAQACRMFSLQDDPAAEFLCTGSALVTVFMSGRSLELADEWLPVFRRTFARFCEAADVELRARTVSMAAFMAIVRIAEDPLFDDVKSLLEKFLDDRGVTGENRAWVLTVLCQFAWARGEDRYLHRIGEEVSRLQETSRRSVSSSVVALAWYATAWIPFGRLDEADRYAARAMELARAEGLDGALGFAACTRMVALAVLGNFEEAENCLEVGLNALRERRGAAYAQLMHGEYLVAARRGQAVRAIQMHRTLEAIYRESGAIHLYKLQCTHHADLLSAFGTVSDADTLIEESASWLRQKTYRTFDAEIEAIRAHIVLKRDGWDAARPRLAHVLDLAEQPAQIGHLRFALYSTQALFAAAVDHDFETGRITRLVRMFDLPPPEAAAERWPWPVRVFALGRFAVDVGGEPLAFSGKVPRKPLALLKALLTNPTGLATATLKDWLWPDLDGDAADKAFRMALMRLREMLGRADAVVLQGGQLFLNPKRIWVDAWRFETVADDLHSSDHNGDARDPAAFYGGTFLPGDLDSPWLVTVRERLRNRFLARVDGRGRAAEKAGRWSDALATYERGIATDDLAESLHQGRIRALLGAGRTADAADAMQQLRRILSRKLGVTPSPETLELFSSKGRTAA